MPSHEVRAHGKAQESVLRPLLWFLQEGTSEAR